MSLQVADMDQTGAELIEAGITLTPVREVWGSKAMYIRDLEGNRLGFGMMATDPMMGYASFHLLR